MPSAPPKAIKAFVTGVIKDQMLESSSTDDAAISGVLPWLALLQMELVQRGVLISLQDNNSSLEKWDATKVLDAVHGSIGKAVLSEGGCTLPTPLLALSAVMAGRVAELCSTLTVDDDTTVLLDAEAVTSSLKRCQEITDPRFQVLLELFVAPAHPPSNAPPGTEVPSVEERASSIRIRLLQIAEGYYLRGAHFNPDLPQMWKKAYDVILARYYFQYNNNKNNNNAQQAIDNEDNVSPPEAAVVLKHMARIATSKGNIKRATELTVRSMESYLQLQQASLQEPTATVNNTNNRKKIEDVFVRPYKPIVKYPLEEAAKTLEACQQHQDVLSPSQVFVLGLLDVQLHLAQEANIITEQAKEAHQQALNRAAETTTTKPGKGGKAIAVKPPKPPTFTAVRDKTRNQVLVRNFKSNHDHHAEQYNVSVVRLRDATLERLGDAQNTSGGEAAMRTNAAISTLQQVLRRYQDQAQALAIGSQTKKGKAAGLMSTEGWVLLGEFLVPFWKFTQQSTQKSAIVEDALSKDNTLLDSWLTETLSEEARGLVEIYATLIPCVEWMVCPTAKADTSCGILPPEYLALVQQTLDALVGLAVEAKKDYQAASNVLKTSTEPLDIKIKQFECARASVQALVLMRQLGSSANNQKKNVNDLIKTHSELATLMAQRADTYQASSVEYGTGFWNFLMAWSGLQQSCWPFCTAPETRLILKHAAESITQATKEWGRPVSDFEQILLDLGQADAECGILSGGLPPVASKLYNGILERSASLSAVLTDPIRSIIKSHCLIGLARLELLDSSKSAEDSLAADLAQKSLRELTTIATDKELPTEYLWTYPGAILSFAKFHMTVSRQLTADALVRSGRAAEAKQFLEDAVRDSPTDAEAAFSLGAFLLRDAFTPAERSVSVLTAAKMQLLKAAKLDSRKAGPFALLGIWYENQGDRKRALGCYSKALLLDPPHPVAGRGVLRLTSFNSARAVIDAAVQTSSAVNGWAWRALGKNKVMVTGENNLGAVALLKALRCRDIDQPQNESSSVFFSVDPADEASTENYLSKEKSESWSELAFCYRRLGRFTAAIRGYYSAIEASGEHVTGSLLCACAAAELELGLAEEASEKFKQALDIGIPATKPIAAFGRGSSLLVLAQRDAQDGKAGAAYSGIQQAIDSFDSSTSSFGCTQKLLGDLYSFGATLPPDIFADPTSHGELKKQILFVEKGEACYRLAVGYYQGVSDDKDESNLLCAATIADGAANILLRAQLKAYAHFKGYEMPSTNEGEAAQEVAELYSIASAEFRRAVELCQDYGPAWCGLGCSLVSSDPLMAQHAFCRSIQLDSVAPDAYANLGFMYTAHKSFSASMGVMGALTQVADTPMMWINRALMLERSAVDDLVAKNGEKAAGSISQAADAYRAALQVVKHPSAMLGLAMTCRVDSETNTATPTNVQQSSHTNISFRESHGYLLEHEGRIGSSDVSITLLRNLMSLEQALWGFSNESGESTSEGRVVAEKSLDAVKSFQLEYSIEEAARLDLDLIQKCLSSIENVASEEEEKTEGDGAPTGMTLARQITFEPHRGDLWVEFAKELFGTSDNGDSSVLQSAQAAASRATQILTHQLTHPNQTGTRGSPPVVNQKDLSEALALSFWLESMLSPDDGANGGEKETDVETAVGESSDEKHRIRTLELQKALMICPNNRFARDALNVMVAQS